MGASWVSWVGVWGAGLPLAYSRGGKSFGSLVWDICLPLGYTTTELGQTQISQNFSRF